MGPIEIAGATLEVVDKAETALKLPNILRKALWNYEDKLLKKWWDELTMRFSEENRDNSAKAIEEKIHNLSQRDAALKAISHSTRLLLESVDESVLVPLAILTAEYVSQLKVADTFFRGMCRALADMSALHVKALKTVLVTVETELDIVPPVVRKGAEVYEIHLKATSGAVGKQTHKINFRWTSNFIHTVEIPASAGIYEPFEEVLGLLLRNGIITQGDNQYSAVVPIAVLRRLIKVMRGVAEEI